MNTRAMPIAALTLLFCAAALAEEPQPATQGDNAAPAETTQTPDAAAPAPAADSAGAQTAPTAQKEMTPEEAAKAAKAGTLEYAKEKIDPSKATPAEIAAHNATAEPDDRITCKKVKPTGSNRPLRLCSTAKQRREMREQSQQAMDASKMDEVGMRGPGPLRGN